MSTPLGELIRQTRLERGLSPERLAGLSGVSRNMIVAVEKGGNVSVQTLEKLAIALAIDRLPLGPAKLVMHGEAGVNVSRVRSLALRLSTTAADLLGELQTPASDSTHLAVPTRRGRSSPPRDLLDNLPADFPLQPVQFEPTKMIDVPVAAEVAAGTGIEPIEHETASIPARFAPKPNERLMRARGDSMTDYNILDGDWLIVQPFSDGEAKRSPIVANGEIVVAWVNTPTHEGLVIKRWFRRKGKKALLSAHEDHPDIEIDPERGDRIEIQGIVRKAFRIPQPIEIPLPKISG